MTPRYALVSSRYKDSHDYIVETKEIKYLNQKNVLQTLPDLNVDDDNLVVRKIGLHLNKVTIIDLDGNFYSYIK